MMKRVVYAYMLDSDDITDIHLIENPFLQRALWRSEVLYNSEFSSQHKFDKKSLSLSCNGTCCFHNISERFLGNLLMGSSGTYMNASQKSCII